MIHEICNFIYEPNVSSFSFSFFSLNQRESKKRERPKNLGKNRKKVPFFRWPELDIETINSAPLEAPNDNETGNRNCATKKRKLFHEDRDTIIDIP